MTKETLVSVVIPVYNEARFIGKCLASLKRQTYKPLQIIVVDDGSTDGTAGVIKGFSVVKRLNQPHLGAGAARNLGAKTAKGDILVFVDADMEFEVDFIALLIAPILKGKTSGTWTGNEQVANWNNVWARCWNYNLGRYTEEMISRFSGQRPVFRAILKSEFDKVNGFDLIGYTDDWTLPNKLGYQPKSTQALMWHHNPDSLLSVFNQAVWLGQRRYKLGILGTLFTLVKHNAASSLLVGSIKALQTVTPAFLPFKLTFDLGLSWGAWLSIFGRKYR